jgi:predicted adenine nucleotide alpha hydrolase (AANH) superfamily ATPase
MEKLLLHTCCVPCANQPIELLINKGYQLDLCWVNSNIHYHDEHQRRYDTLSEYVESLGLVVHEVAYLPGDWFQAIRNDGGVFPLTGGEDDIYMQGLRQTRCRLCYRHRFMALAKMAVELQIDTIATTLAVSVYQYQDIVAAELKNAAEQYGLRAFFEDWRGYYQQGQSRARALGLYRQQYCGCEFSRQEAAIEREAKCLRNLTDTATC